MLSMPIRANGVLRKGTGDGILVGLYFLDEVRLVWYKMICGFAPAVFVENVHDLREPIPVLREVRS